MTLGARIRGHDCVFDPSVGWWRWADTSELMGDPDWQAEPWVVAGYEVEGNTVHFPDPYPAYRGCVECGRLPTPEGYDACLGVLPDVVSACCGHGGRSRFTVSVPPMWS